jgi:hypothetical protein
LHPRDAVRVVRTEKQKDNLAKFFWDMAKVALTVFVFGQLARPQGITTLDLLSGTGIGFTLALWAYILDGWEMKR